MPEYLGTCECSRCNEQRDCGRWELRFDDATITRHVLCDACYMFYEDYQIEDEDDYDADDVEEAPEADPQDAECEDDPCIVLHYAVACGGDCAGDPM